MNHSTHMSTTTTHPPSAANALRTMTQNLQCMAYMHQTRGLHMDGPPSHRAILRHAAQDSAPFRVRPAPMPSSAGRDA